LSDPSFFSLEYNTQKKELVMKMFLHVITTTLLMVEGIFNPIMPPVYYLLNAVRSAIKNNENVLHVDLF
jgi:hypothetical protein